MQEIEKEQLVYALKERFKILHWLIVLVNKVLINIFIECSSNCIECNESTSNCVSCRGNRITPNCNCPDGTNLNSD